MNFVPHRRLGLVLGATFLALLLAATGVGVNQLATSGISGLTVLWLCLSLLCGPLAALVAYRMLGLLSASYRLDRDGFYLTWGLASEQVPLASISTVRPADQLQTPILPGPGIWWPGCLVGQRLVPDLGKVEFFATTWARDMILLSFGDRHLAISPPDPQAFIQAFLDSTRLGSLERIPSRSQRANFLLRRIWSDQLARVLILVGLTLPISLLGYLAARAQDLPPLVPFGFDASGAPDPMAPPGRLLLLPLISAISWLADLAIGVWFYRRRSDRILAYGLWGAAILVGLLLWGAALHLLTAP